MTTLAELKRNHPVFFKNGNLERLPERYNVKTVGSTTYLLVTKFAPDKQVTSIWYESRGILMQLEQRFTGRGSVELAKNFLKENK